MLRNTKQCHKSYRIQKLNKKETWIYKQHKHWIDA